MKGKSLLLFTIAITQIKQLLGLSKWFEIGSGTDPITPMTIGGLNGKYFIHGQGRNWWVFTIDWGTQTHLEVEYIHLAEDAKLTWNSRVRGDKKTNNVVMVSAAAWRFNFTPGGTPNPEKYPFLEVNYAYPRNIIDTVFMMIATSAPTPGYRFYRVQSHTIADFKEYTVSDSSIAYGPLYGTNYVIFSGRQSNTRLVFDHTKGHKDGTDSTVGTHTKVGQPEE